MADIVSKEDFLSWVKKRNWLEVGEMPTPTGRQVTYLSPAGNFIFAIYDITGKLVQIAFPAMQPPSSVFRGGRS